MLWIDMSDRKLFNFLRISQKWSKTNHWHLKYTKFLRMSWYKFWHSHSFLYTFSEQQVSIVDQFFDLCFWNWLFFLFQKSVLSTFLWPFCSILSLLFIFDSLFSCFPVFLFFFLGFSTFLSKNICKMYKVIIHSMHTLLVANNIENCNEHFLKMNIWTFVDHFFDLCFKNWLFFCSKNLFSAHFYDHSSVF